MKDKITTHPSYGMLGFSRVNMSGVGGGAALFGSDLTHNTVIEMTLHHAELGRGLNRNWYHATDMITRVRMSQNQFSELITSMNMGDGVPVTLLNTEKDGKIDGDTCDNVRKLHETEFRDTARKVGANSAQLLKDAERILATGTAKKADREELLAQLTKVVQDIRSNMPYMEKCFKESMDDVVTDAKGSIEAFYQHRVIESGLAAIQDGAVAPKLIEEDDHL